MNTVLFHLLDDKNGNGFSAPPLPVPSFLEMLPNLSSQVSLEGDNAPMRPMVTPVASATLQSFSTTSSQTFMLTSAISSFDPVKTSPSKRPRLVDIAPKQSKKANTFAAYNDIPQTQDKSSYPPATPEDVDDEQAKKDRNRFHAQMSRMRRKSLQQEMQETLTRLHHENALLRCHIATRPGHTGKADRMIQAQKDLHTSLFVAQLQQPKHRIVKGKTLRFLKRLRKNLPASTTYKAVEDGVGCTSDDDGASRSSLHDLKKEDQTDIVHDIFQVVA
jgi:hypothetical protein